MKHITFPGAGRLAGVAALLELLGHDTSDQQIALGMQAPYLLIRDQSGYRAGSRLYEPAWLNLYLLSRGFRLTETKLSRSDVRTFLRHSSPVMLKIRIDKGLAHPIIFTGYENKRYLFDNIKPLDSNEPDHFSYSSDMLVRRLEECVTLWTVEKCPPQPVDCVPLLLESLRTLDAYQEDLMAILGRTLTRKELAALDFPFFRALMKDLQPLSLLMEDLELAEELRLLQHDYSHIFTIHGSDTAVLSEKLPRTSIQRCLGWLREDIIDRLYVLGADDALIDGLTRHD